MKKKLMMVAIVLLGAACKKSETPANLTTEAKVATVASTEQKLVTNLKNPFDNAGQLHNKGLDFILKHLKDVDRSTLKDIETLAQNYATDSLHAPLPAASHSNIQKLLRDGKNGFANVISALTFSPQAKDYARKLMGLMSGDVALNTEADYNKLEGAVANLETIIAADTKLPQSERKALLQGTSVARYSMSYWSKSDLPAEFHLFVALHDVVGTLMFGPGFGMFASAAARAVLRQNWGFFNGQS